MKRSRSFLRSLPARAIAAAGAVVAGPPSTATIAHGAAAKPAADAASPRAREAMRPGAAGVRR